MWWILGFSILLICIIIISGITNMSNNDDEEVKIIKQRLLDIKNKSDLFSIERNRIVNKISPIIEENYLVEACTSCYENKMKLRNISPKGKSITYLCAHCNKERKAASLNPNIEKNIVSDFQEYLCKRDEYFFSEEMEFYKRAVNNSGFSTGENRFDFPEIIQFDEIVFNTIDAIMPYDNTLREVIPEHIRNIVWRRDLGKCTKCGSKNNLQFDHIIPVAKGGSTTLSNLELLCKACNQSKGAKI